MNWMKKGLIFKPDKQLHWRQLYAMMPTPVYIEDKGVIRIFYGTTDSEKFGLTSYIDVDATNPSIVKYIHNLPLCSLGNIGTFDDSGVIASSVVCMHNRNYLYYVGFQRTVRVPYMLFSGLLVSEGTTLEKFNRYSQAPIIDRGINNVYSNAAPFVLYDGDEKIFKMWFWLGKEWVTINEKLYINAEIHYTTSADGIHWNKDSVLCLSPDSAHQEFSLGRPWVVKNNGAYKMYYSVRYADKLYRLGFAESADGMNWIRKDNEIGMDVSVEGWDSEMICYPAVITVKNKTYLFYNGNNNGETGFGYAELLND